MEWKVGYRGSSQPDTSTHHQHRAPREHLDSVVLGFQANFGRAHCCYVFAGTDDGRCILEGTGDGCCILEGTDDPFLGGVFDL
jgi:hypothetical protein